MQEGGKAGSEILADKELLLEASSPWPDCSALVRVEFKENEPSINFRVFSVHQVFIFR